MHERGGARPPRLERGALEARDGRVTARQQLQLDQLDQDLRHLLLVPQFQRYVQHLMRKCGTFEHTETLQASHDFRALARRGVGMEISAELGRADRKAATELMAKMLYAPLDPEDPTP